MASAGCNVGPVSDEIKEVRLYNILPLALHGYIAPFMLLYAGWLYGWVTYGVTDYWEAGLIVLAIIGLLQILTSLFCLWFVPIRCLLTCSKVSNLG